MPPKKNVAPVKPPEGSTMIHEESEDMSFRVSQLEKNFKGMVRTLYLYNMEKKLEESMETNMGNMEKKLETNMGNMEKKLEESMEMKIGNVKKMEKLEESMERIVNLIQHPEEKPPNDDNVGQGTHDERNSSHFEKPSFNKSTPGGFDSNIGSNQG